MLILTLNNGEIRKIKEARTFMCGLGLIVRYLDDTYELLCHLEWVSVMKKENKK